ncbi:MAG: aromatic acid exporter family protein, partial [Bacillota bacterium]|nr:aromatic acid exporter family protein [Bacillota bacterium]
MIRIGLRIWKTGIATAITLLVTSYFSELDPVIAVVTAIISLQPSIAESIKRGWHRIQATLVGAAIGITLGYIAIELTDLWIVLPILAGLGVVLAIFLSNKFKIQEAVISAIAVVATMVGITSSIVASGGYRLLSTLLGIIVATIINLIFIPPQYRPTLIEEFRSINEQIIILFKSSMRSFISCCGQDLLKAEERVDELKEELEKTKQHLAYYKDELGYRRYLATLPKFVVKEVVIFEKSLKTLDLLLDRILNIAKTTDSRYHRKGGQKKINAEYGKLLKTIVKMSNMVTSVQGEVINLLFTYDSKEAEIIINNL